MPVQVPKLERVAPVQDQQGRQLSFQAPDLTAGQSQVDSAIVGLGEQAVRIYEKKKDDEAKSIATEVVNKYESWYNKQLLGDSNAKKESERLGLRGVKGDPSDNYNEFDKKAEEFRKELILGDYDERTKSYINQKLAESHNGLYNKRLTYHHSQKIAHQQRVREDRAQLIRKSAADAIGYLDTNDPATLAPFEANLQQLINNRIEQGEATDLVEPTLDPSGYVKGFDEDGNAIRVKLSDQTKVQIAEDLSEATYGAVNNLIAIGKVKEAEYVLEKHGVNLDETKKAKIEKSLEEARIEEGAFELVESTAGQPLDEQMKAVQASSADVKVKQKAAQLIDSRQRYQDNVRNRVAKQSYNNSYDHLTKIMDSNRPYDSVFQLEQDPVYKLHKDKMTPQQKKSLRAMIEKPDTSDTSAYVEALDMYRRGEFKNMPAQELQVVTIGLNRSDSNKVFELWREQNTDTPGQERSANKSLQEAVYRAFESRGELKFNRMGKETKKSKERRQKLIQDINQRADFLPANMSVNEVEDYAEQVVNEFLIQEEKNKRGIFDVIGDWISGTEEPEEQTNIPLPRRTRTVRGEDLNIQRIDLPDTSNQSPGVRTVSAGDLSEADMAKAMADFEAANNREAESLDELMKWYNSQGGR